MRVFNVILCGLTLTFSSLALGETDPKGEHLLRLPARMEKALGGSEFMKKIEKYGPAHREKAIVSEILRGNIPSFLRSLTPVESRVKNGPLKGRILRFWTLPDYLAVGSDKDYVRVPLNLYSAEIIAKQLGLSLPTRKMVDAVYAHASIRLKPQPVPYSPAIASTANIIKHHRMVQNQLPEQMNAMPGMIVAGHKKDVVQSRRLIRKPSSIAIYGWHQLNAQPIQPLSTIHSADYADYSHGIRLVANEVMIGNRTVDLRDVLAHDRLAGFFSDEGVIPQRNYTASRLNPAMILASNP